MYEGTIYVGTFQKKNYITKKKPGVNPGNIHQQTHIYHSLLSENKREPEDLGDNLLVKTYSLNCTAQGDDTILSYDTQLQDYFESNVDSCADVNLRHYLVEF